MGPCRKHKPDRDQIFLGAEVITRSRHACRELLPKHGRIARIPIRRGHHPPANRVVTLSNSSHSTNESIILSCSLSLVRRETQMPRNQVTALPFSASQRYANANVDVYVLLDHETREQSFNFSPLGEGGRRKHGKHSLFATIYQTHKDIGIALATIGGWSRVNPATPTAECACVRGCEWVLTSAFSVTGYPRDCHHSPVLTENTEKGRFCSVR